MRSNTLHTFYRNDIFYTLYDLQLLFVFITDFCPQQEPVGFKHVGQITKQSK